ncbi:MAG: choice-of-anchor L domain-containing protein [Bacteroidia bacterium]
MKKIRLHFIKSILLLLFCTFAFSGYSQLTTKRTGNYGSITYLVNHVLLGNGLTATNVSINGPDTSYGFFNGITSNIGMDSGLIMTNGTITLANGPNQKGSYGDKSDGKYTSYNYCNECATEGWPNASTYQDSDLANLIGEPLNKTYSCNLLQFDFVAVSDSISFQYVFGSNESPCWAASSYVDDFGFFLSGPGITGQTGLNGWKYSNNAENIALIPGSTNPVDINSVNCSSNSGYFICNYPNSGNGCSVPCTNCPASAAATSVGYSGFSTVFTAKALVQCGKTYHIKLGIANITNAFFDSGVFLKAGSFVPNTTPMTVSANSLIMCTGKSVTITANNANSYTWSPATGLSATTGASVTATPTATTTYTVIGAVSGGCDDTAKILVTVNPLPTVSVSALPNTPICSGNSTTLSASGSSTSYVWSPSTGLNSTTAASVTASPTTTTKYIVTGTNSNGCENKDSITVDVNPTPTVTASVKGSSSTICGGDSVSLLAGGATTYTWSPAGGLNTTTGAQVTATPTATTTYTVTGTSGSCTNTAPVTVTVNPTPNINIAPKGSAICPGNSDTLFAGSGATSYVWTPATGLSCTSCAKTIATPTATTTYYVTGTIGSCSKTDSTTITVATSLTVAATPASPTICSGDSVLLQATGAANYTWSPPTGLSCTACSNPNAGPGSNITYTVTGTSGSCNAPPATVSVSVTPTPSVTANSSSLSVCSGSTATLTASGGTTYTWSPSSGLSSSTGSPVTATPTSATTYVVTGTSNGCSNTGSVSISINPAPSVALATSQPPNICSGVSDTITATGAVTYVWSPAVVSLNSSGSPVKATPTSTTTYTVIGTSALDCPDTTQITINVTPTPTLSVSNSTSICPGDSIKIGAGGATNYTWSPGTGLSSTSGDSVFANPGASTTYTVTGMNGSCSSTGTVNVNVGNLVVTAAANDSTICYGANATLTASGAATYTWSGSGLNSATGSPVTATPTATTTYTVTGTSGGLGCIADTTITITVNPNPSLTISSGGTMICSGGSGTTITVTGAGVTNYLWSPSNGLSCSTCPNPNANPSSSTIYTVTGTNTFGCSADSAVSIIVDVPVINAIASSTNICNGNITNISASGGVTYVWSPSSGLSSTSGANVSGTTSVNTTYTVIGTDTAGCIDSNTVSITVNPLPNVSASASSSSICSGNSTTLSANGANTYVWSNGATGSPVNVSPAATTTYTVIGTSLANCPDTASVSVTVNVSPTIGIQLKGGDTLCPNQTATMIASGANTYTWEPSTGGLNNTTGDTVIASPPSSPIIYTVIGSNGTCSDSAHDTLYLYPKLNVSMSPDSICLGKNGQVSIIATGGKPAYSYVWNNGISTNGPGPFIVSPASSTYYECTVTDGCGSIQIDSMQVVTESVPTAKFTPTPQTIWGGQYVSFVNWSTGATSYYWNLGNETTSNQVNPFYQYDIPDTFIVYLIAYNNYGCYDSISDTIYVLGGIYVPNVFTPNGDGINDVFHITAGGMQTYYIEIFNRWGEKVFEADSPNIDWTGRSMSGIEESDGTYYYIIKATDYKNKKYNLDGYLQLIR